jgi:hypothetical protein
LALDPMHIAIRRTIALLLGTAAGLGILWGLDSTWSREGPAAMGFHDGRKDLAELEDYLVQGDTRLGASRGPLGHLLVTEPVAERLFQFSKQYMVYDPLCYFRRPPFKNVKHRWEEHPDGAWWMRTNSLGLREDSELAPEAPDLRVFITGDSHTDGVCNNRETFSSRLEVGLSAAVSGRSVEVLNAGVGGYSFYNYIGAFERFYEFDMQVFVVVVYGGNDFENIVTPYYFWRGEDRPPWRESWALVEAGIELDRSSMAQGLMPITYFAQAPWLEVPMVEEAVRATRELQRRCNEEGVELVVVYLPSVFEVKPGKRPDLWPEMVIALELDREELGVTRRQANLYLEGLAEAGVKHVDLRPAFLASRKELYWRKDLHLNLQGNQLVADVVLPHVQAAGRRARAADDR